MRSVVLTAGGVAKKTVFQLLDWEAIVQPKVRAVSSLAAPIPRYNTEANTCNAAHCKIGMFDKGDFDIEEDLLKSGDGKFGLDDRRRRRDLRQSLEDRDT
jgi:hypothetical protein